MSSGLARFRSELTAHLDWFAERGQKVRFWWRDDDATEPSEALDTLLSFSSRHDIDVALAVIPKQATQALADRLKTEPHAIVLQHGWQHRNFQRKDLGEKAAELGSRRNPDELMAELAKGKARLEELFGASFVPAMVPPWNRIAPGVARLLPDIGIHSLSTYLPEVFPGLMMVQTHVDIIKWKTERRFIGWKSAANKLDFQLCRRRTNPDEPLGILTHHLDHDDGCSEFLDEFLSIATHHDGADWPRVKALFGV